MNRRNIHLQLRRLAGLDKKMEELDSISKVVRTEVHNIFWNLIEVIDNKKLHGKRKNPTGR